MLRALSQFGLHVPIAGHCVKADAPGIALGSFLILQVYSGMVGVMFMCRSRGTAVGSLLLMFVFVDGHFCYDICGASLDSVIVQNSFTRPPGGNHVDGLPPALSSKFC